MYNHSELSGGLAQLLGKARCLGSQLGCIYLEGILDRVFIYENLGATIVLFFVSRIIFVVIWSVFRRGLRKVVWEAYRASMKSR